MTPPQRLAASPPGGIAAALGSGDTPDRHLHDTLVAGAGVCDEAAVRVLVTEGPEAVRELIALDPVPGVDVGVAGVTLHVLGEGQRDGVGAVPGCRVLGDHEPAHRRSRPAQGRARAGGDPWRPLLEASGGLTPARAREVAETGMDLIAVGALTHSAPVLDIEMDLRG